MLATPLTMAERGNRGQYGRSGSSGRREPNREISVSTVLRQVTVIRRRSAEQLVALNVGTISARIVICTSTTLCTLVRDVRSNSSEMLRSESCRHRIQAMLDAYWGQMGIDTLQHLALHARIDTLALF